MSITFTIFFFLLGLIIGSFLNVVIFRYNTKKSLGGRSACMSCQKKLHWYELVPLLSFFALGGRCSSCKSKIGAQYPAVEFITGLIFALLFCRFQEVLYFQPLAFVATYIYYAAAFSVLLVIAVYDLRHKIIPDMLVFLFGLWSFVGLFLFGTPGLSGLFGLSNFYPHFPTLLELLSGLVIAVPFAFIWLVSSGRAMGLGDAKLAVGLGWFLGISRMLSAVLVAVWSGAIVGIILILFSGRHGWKSEIPFAPFLLFGVLVAFLFDLHIFTLLPIF